jgi:CRISPR-associated exonuclease Cas4
MAEKYVTGLQIFYYFVCKRKLWYFSNQLCMESENESVQLGKILDESSYKNKTKHILIDNIINIDFISEHKLLHEVKKSRHIEEAGVWQVKYYLYYLKTKGVEGLKGKIDYPLLKHSLSVELSEQDEKILETVIAEINEIVNLKLPPSTETKKFCKSCAYYDLCMI